MNVVMKIFVSARLRPQSQHKKNYMKKVGIALIAADQQSSNGT